jgi:flagellar motor switch protein FliG
MSAATIDPAQATPVDASKFTREKKLAALLMVLGSESAAEVLKGLSEQQVAAVTSAMTSLPVIDQHLQREILRDFSQVAVTASSAAMGGLEFAQSTLEKAVGQSQARQILSQVAPSRSTGSPMHALIQKEVRQLYGALKSEQPQTVALVASFLDEKKASQLLALFSDEQRSQIVERLATLGPTPVAVVETLCELLLTRIGAHVTFAFSQTGGVQPTATVLKAMNRNASKALLDALEQRNPELGKIIRNEMFTVADMAKLEIAVLQKILREVDSRTLATALRSVSDSVKAKILSGLSKRAAEAIEEEMSFLGKVKAKEVEAAQQALIDTVRRLETEGQIEINEEPPA